MAKLWLERRDCDNDDFPEVCLKCGQPTGEFVRRTFHWMPGWVYVTLLIHLLVFVIVAAITRKSLKTRVPMCREHRNHWFWRTLIIVASIPVLIAGIIGLVMAVESMRGGGEILLLSIPGAILLWVVAAIVLSATAIRPTKIDERGMQLTGVSQAFVDAYLGSSRRFQPQLPDIDEEAARRWGEGRGDHRPRREEPGRYQRPQAEERKRDRPRDSEDEDY